MNHQTIREVLKETHPIVYISGPYRAPTEYAVEMNIRRAWDASVRLAAAKIHHFCPHSNTHHMGGVVEDAQWLRLDLNILKACGSILMLPGWEKSEGACIEHYAAEDPGEFFAVMSEGFFAHPEELDDAYPEVYDRLREFYRQDPLAWPEDG